jgi:hypothetical protein
MSISNGPTSANGLLGNAVDSKTSLLETVRSLEGKYPMIPAKNRFKCAAPVSFTRPAEADLRLLARPEGSRAGTLFRGGRGVRTQKPTFIRSPSPQRGEGSGVRGPGSPTSAATTSGDGPPSTLSRGGARGTNAEADVHPVPLAPAWRGTRPRSMPSRPHHPELRAVPIRREIALGPDGYPAVLADRVRRYFSEKHWVISFRFSHCYRGRKTTRPHPVTAVSKGGSLDGSVGSGSAHAADAA